MTTSHQNTRKDYFSISSTGQNIWATLNRHTVCTQTGPSMAFQIVFKWHLSAHIKWEQQSYKSHNNCAAALFLKDTLVSLRWEIICIQKILTAAQIVPHSPLPSLQSEHGSVTYQNQQNIVKSITSVGCPLKGSCASVTVNSSRCTVFSNIPNCLQMTIISLLCKWFKATTI